MGELTMGETMSDQMIQKLRRMPKRRRDALEKYVMAIMNGAPLDAGGWKLYREKWEKWNADQRSKMRRYIAVEFARGNMRLVLGGADPPSDDLKGDFNL